MQWEELDGSGTTRKSDLIMIKKLLCRLGYHSPVIEPTISLSKDTKETKFMVQYGIIKCKNCNYVFSTVVLNITI